MNQEPKQQWQRPQLIILGRGRPEEVVLLACKDTKQKGPPSGKECNSAANDCKTSTTS